MASRLCPYCKAESHLTMRWGVSEQYKLTNGSYTYRTWAAATCDNCAAVSAANLQSTQFHIEPRTASEDLRMLERDFASRITWFPKSVVNPQYPDVEEHVARCAIEAHQAASIGANIAAVLMARTTIEAAAKSKGITRGNLVSKIDKMGEEGHIRNSVVRAAHALRDFGNDMAHGDVLDLPTKEDTEDALELMDVVLRDVYEGEAATARILSRRDRSNPGTPAGN